MRQLAIVGAGGHGAVVAEIAEALRKWDRILFLDDTYPRVTAVFDYSVVAQSHSIPEYCNGETDIVIAIGDNDARSELAGTVKDHDGNLTTLIHPSACVSRSASIGDGTVICAGVVVNARASVGICCILNTSSTVDHDCLLGDTVHVCPGANLAGGVTIGDKAWIGIGATVIGGVRIGKAATIGASAAVISNVPPAKTFVGVPAAEVGSR